MFPGIDGFHWTVGHISFLLLFFAVALTIASTVISAAWRTARHLRSRRAAEWCWQNDFERLPQTERRCRHELAGRVVSRICENAFDCRHCSQYSQFAELPGEEIALDLGLHYPEDRPYHRGHTWVKPEKDGTLTIGLDDLAERVIGSPDSVKMPGIGSEIELNGTAWRMKKNGNEVRVRAPIEGTVAAVGGPREGWYLKIRPRLDPNDPTTLRHLLRGAEVHGWLTRELERLQLQLRPPNAGPTLADGGVLIRGLMDAIPEADWPTVLEDTFLEA